MTAPTRDAMAGLMLKLALDIGGVFYRGWPDADFWPRWTARTGLVANALEDFLSHAPEARDARLGRITAAEYYARAGERLAADPGMLKALAEEAYPSDFNETLAAQVRAWRAAGVAVSACTNSLSSEAEVKARPALAGLFDHVITSRDVGAGKPDPAIFRALVERLQAEPAGILFVDDALAHVEAARAAGLRAVHFRSTAQAIADLSAFYPDTRASSRR